MIPPSAFRLQQLCAMYLRPVADWDYTNPASPTPIFVPPLTTAEQATLADLQGLAHNQIDLTPTDWAKIAARLPNIRAFRQLTRPTVMAMTQTDRDKLYFDTLSDMAALLVVLLRQDS